MNTLKALENELSNVTLHDLDNSGMTCEGCGIESYVIIIDDNGYRVCDDCYYNLNTGG